MAMALLDGWQRKLALLPLSLFLLGWLIYSSGFTWQLVKWVNETSLNSTLAPIVTSRHDPLVFPYYVVLVGGPFVFLLGLLHTVLPGVASSILGFISALVSNMFFVSVGWVIYYWGLYLKSSVDDNFSVDVKAILVFGGALLTGLSWCFVQMLSVSFNYQRRSDPFNYDTLINHDLCQDSDRKRNCPFTPGFGRIFSVPFVLLSAIGWCVFVDGIDKLPKQLLQSNTSYLDFSVYGSMVIGPLLFLATLLHAGCLRSASVVMGIFTSILHTVYAIFMGYIVTEFGRYIYFSCQEYQQLQTTSSESGSGFIPAANCSPSHSSIDINVIYVFSGAAGSLFFWTVVLALWPFYRHHPSSSSVNTDSASDSTTEINSTRPITYGTMQMQESLAYSSYSAHHPRQSLLIVESGEHK
jgi:hypothetical protein